MKPAKQTLIPPVGKGGVQGDIYAECPDPAHLKLAQTLLLIDPAAKRRRQLAKILKASSKSVFETGSVEEAFSILADRRIGIVVVAHGPDSVDGVDFCRKLRSVPATRLLPAFLLASVTGLEEEILALRAGASEFFPNSVDSRLLLARIDSHLRQSALIDSLDQSDVFLCSLAQSIEERDPQLGHHCQRLAFLGSVLGEALRLPSHDLATLRRGGYLHDIGKVGIPDSILFKPGPLTPEEWEVMKSHSERGERICSRTKSLVEVLPIIRHHHEKWDGTGYPDGLRGEQIPLLARIIQVVDIYDALTTARPYKPAFSRKRALEIMRNEADRGWRDPALVEIFAELIPTLESEQETERSLFSLQALEESIRKYGSINKAVNAEKSLLSRLQE